LKPLSFAQVAAAYPAKARRPGAGGHVISSASSPTRADLKGCATQNEEPKGLDFAAAAKTLAPTFSPAAA